MSDTRQEKALAALQSVSGRRVSGTKPMTAAEILAARDGLRGGNAAGTEFAEVVSQVSGGLSSIGDAAGDSLLRVSRSLGVFGQGLQRALSGLLVLPMRLAMVPLRALNAVITRLTGRQADAAAADDDAHVWETDDGDEATSPTLRDINDLIERNIVFCDNAGRPIYSADVTRNVGRLGKGTHDLLTAYMLDAIRQCAHLATNMPPVGKGRYQGRPMATVMRDADEDDLALFFSFAYGYFKKYSGKKVKIAEAFATWVLLGGVVA